MNDRGVLSELELEWQCECLLCGSQEDGIAVKGIEDYKFKSSKQKWQMIECPTCRSLYLSPRPTRSSIIHAYKGYYTHHFSNSSTAPARGLIAALKNGIVSERFGADIQPRTKVPFVTAAISRMLFGRVARRYRLLPKLKPYAKIMDVGCGSGKFLRLAKHAKWEAIGIDFDKAAVAAALDEGLNAIVGDILELDFEKGSFDVVTFSHSLEHLFEPQGALKRAHELLSPGGCLHLELPNPSATGRSLFGRHWKGYDAPRHLHLPNQDALRRILSEIGFAHIKFHRCGWATGGMFKASNTMLIDAEGAGIGFLPLVVKGLLSSFGPKKNHEFTVVIATK